MPDAIELLFLIGLKRESRYLLGDEVRAISHAIG